jgi:hypothetical protein|tara:strand:+ start:1111 stop:1266 length:156 start_codon:yes stop_codon:yes gene_type:complete
MKECLFTNVDAVVKEQIASLRNIKIHYQMSGDFDKIQKVSLAIKQLENLNK